MAEVIVQGRRIDIAAIEIPWHLNILLDVSGSMDEGNKLSDAKKGIVTFLMNISQRRSNLGDWVTASCFSGYSETPDSSIYYKTMDSYCRVAHQDSLLRLFAFIDHWKPVWHGTALYDAIVIASNDLYSFASAHETPGLNVVIAVTDGEDNADGRKPSEMGYPNSALDLALIGVGSSALNELDRVKQYATSTHHIKDFGDLYQAMYLCLGAVIDRQLSLRARIKED